MRNLKEQVKVCDAKQRVCLAYRKMVAKSLKKTTLLMLLGVGTVNVCGQEIHDEILDSEINWNATKLFVCASDYTKDYLFFAPTNVPDCVYSFSVSSTCGAFVWRYSLGGYMRVLDTTKVDGYVLISECINNYGPLDRNLNNLKVPSDDVVLHVTRYDTLRGTIAQRDILYHVNALSAKYSMSIDNGFEFVVGDNKTNIMNQGSRVQFVSMVTTNTDHDLTYKWVIEEPINTEYSQKYGEGIGQEGLTSDLHNPSCFYYNGGRYPVSLTVSDGECSATVRDTSLYIPESSVRSYKASVWIEGDDVDLGEELSENIVVYPNVVSDCVKIESNKKDGTHQVLLIDEVGRVLLQKQMEGFVEMSMDGYPVGLYFVVIDSEKKYKLIKK